jgi:hypothetical protein
MKAGLGESVAGLIPHLVVEVTGAVEDREQVTVAQVEVEVTTVETEETAVMVEEVVE